MNLRRAMFWKQTVSAASPASDAAESAHPPVAPLKPAEPAAYASDSADWQSARVIPLQRHTAAVGLGDSPTSDDFVKPPPQLQRVKGLMNTQELEAFFKTNQFGFGRHHGSHYRTAEALERGLDAVVGEFQNIVTDLAERRQAKLDKLQMARQDVAALSPSIADQLSLASEQTRRDIAVLREQAALASERKGWVLDALNRYRLGFDRGVREALDFELLNA